MMRDFYQTQEEVWATNANAFVAQEDDDTQAYSIRVAGFDLLAVCTFLYSKEDIWLISTPGQCLVDRLPVQTTATFHTIIQHIVSVSRQSREEGNEHW
jgi:hypothetical protein